MEVDAIEEHVRKTIMEGILRPYHRSQHRDKIGIYDTYLEL
jgi:hypothetical protein